jgi:hypothetical protein
VVFDSLFTLESSALILVHIPCAQYQSGIPGPIDKKDYQVAAFVSLPTSRIYVFSFSVASFYEAEARPVEKDFLSFILADMMLYSTFLHNLW